MSAAATGTAQALDSLRGRKYISLTSFRRDGSAVSTPVEFVMKDGAVYVRAREGSGKIRRIRANPNVTLAPCDIRGVVKGPVFEGKGAAVEDDGTLYSLFGDKYGLFWRLGTALRKTRPQPLKIVPKGSETK